MFNMLKLVIGLWTQKPYWLEHRLFYAWQYCWIRL